MNKKNGFELSPRASKIIIYTATFVNLLFWFDNVEQIFYACCGDGFYLYFFFIILSWALWFLSRIFYRVASLGAKIVMYVCYAFIFANLFLGILNEHWDRELERFTESEFELLMNYARDETIGLNPNLELLAKTDSLIIIGKPVNRVNNLCAIGSNPIVSGLMNNNDTLNNISYRKFVPLDFKMYYSLIENKNIESWKAIEQYNDWNYPNYIIFAFAPNIPSAYRNYKKDIEIRIPFLYVCMYESYSQYDGVIDFIWELFNGKLKERYTLFFGKFKELFFPTYVSAEMKDDPYFLIYQGKYEEARAGLKDLPPARREFCRKKLEALGY